MEAVDRNLENESNLRRNLLLVASYVLLMVLIAISYSCGPAFRTAASSARGAAGAARRFASLRNGFRLAATTSAVARRSLRAPPRPPRALLAGANGPGWRVGESPEALLAPR